MTEPESNLRFERYGMRLAELEWNEFMSGVERFSTWTENFGERDHEVRDYGKDFLETVPHCLHRDIALSLE